MLQPKLTSVKAMPNMVLARTYETREHKLFDVVPYADGSWYGKLRDSSYFQSVRLLPDGSGIEWSDGQDISPLELYECSVSI